MRRAAAPARVAAAAVAVAAAELSDMWKDGRVPPNEDDDVGKSDKRIATLRNSSQRIKENLNDLLQMSI